MIINYFKIYCKEAIFCRINKLLLMVYVPVQSYVHLVGELILNSLPFYLYSGSGHTVLIFFPFFDSKLSNLTPVKNFVTSF